jgi:hypothetical protein
LEWISKEAIVAKLEVFSWNLPGENEKNHEQPQASLSLGRDLELDTSEIRSVGDPAVRRRRLLEIVFMIQ